MRLILFIAFVTALFGLVSSLAVPASQDLVPRARTSSPGPSRGRSKSPGPSRGRSKSTSPPNPSHGRNKSPTPGPSGGGKSPSPTPKVPVQFRGTATKSFKMFKIPKDSAEQKGIKDWHETVVRAHAATYHPTATEIHISKLVHTYGSKDQRPHVSYEVKGPNGWIKNNVAGSKNQNWHHAPVDHSEAPQAYRDAVERKGKKL